LLKLFRHAENSVMLLVFNLQKIFQKGKSIWILIYFLQHVSKKYSILVIQFFNFFRDISHTSWILLDRYRKSIQFFSFFIFNCSFSWCEKNWITYSVHSLKRNKMDTKKGDECWVCVHSNLQLLSKKDERYK